MLQVVEFDLLKKLNTLIRRKGSKNYILYWNGKYTSLAQEMMVEQ